MRLSCPTDPATYTIADWSYSSVTYTANATSYGSTRSTFYSYSGSSDFTYALGEFASAVSDCASFADYYAIEQCGDTKGDFNLFWNLGAASHWTCIVWQDSLDSNFAGWSDDPTIACSYSYQQNADLVIPD